MSTFTTVSLDLLVTVCGGEDAGTRSTTYEGGVETPRGSATGTRSSSWSEPSSYLRCLNDRAKESGILESPEAADARGARLCAPLAPQTRPARPQ